MYLTRRLVDHRLTDEERRTVTDVEEYISSRNMVLDIRDILVRHLNNEKVQPNLHVMVPKKRYSIAFAAGMQVTASSFFRALERTMAEARIRSVELEAHTEILLYISRYGQKWSLVTDDHQHHHQQHQISSSSPFDFFRALEVPDPDTGRPQFPCHQNAVIDIAATRFCPSPRSTLDFPVLKFAVPLDKMGDLPHQLPAEVMDTLSNPGKEITLVTNGHDADQLHYGWVTARLNKAPIPLSSFGGGNLSAADGRLTRVVIYNGLKHVFHGVSTTDLSAKVKTKRGGRTRLAKLKELETRLQDLVAEHRKDPDNKAAIYSQCLRIELRLMGHCLKDKFLWLAHGPEDDGSPAYIPNIDGCGQALFESEVAEMLGVKLEFSYMEAERMLESARTVRMRLDPISGVDNRPLLDREQKGLLELANHLGLIFESLAARLGAKSQLVLRSAYLDGRQVLKSSRQRIEERKKSSVDGAEPAAPAAEDTDAERAARIVRT